jgi:hypothetical protein
MEYNGLHKHSTEHITGTATIAVFAALAIATLMWPALAAILDIIFLTVGFVIGLTVLGIAVWAFELYPANRAQHHTDHDTPAAEHAVPVLNGQPLSGDLPDIVPARAWQGGGFG